MTDFVKSVLIQVIYSQEVSSIELGEYKGYYKVYYTMRIPFASAVVIIIFPIKVSDH